jgi:hypothetical protein
MNARNKLISVTIIYLAVLLICESCALAQDTLADYSEQTVSPDSLQQEYLETGTTEGIITLLPQMPWNNPDIIDPSGDAKDNYEDITAVYVDEDEKRVYFRIKLLATGDSAEAFTRYVYVLIDGKIGGKKRVAKNVHADIPWDILIKLKNPDDLAAYTINSLLTIEIMNFSSNPEAKVMSFYIEKRFIREIISWEGNDDLRFQVFTQNKETDLFGDGTDVFYLHNATHDEILPDITRMLETVSPAAEEPDNLYSAPQDSQDKQEEPDGPVVDENESEKKTDPQYITTQIWLVPQVVLAISAFMLAALLSLIIALLVIKFRRRRSKAIALKREDSRNMLKREDIKNIMAQENQIVIKARKQKIKKQTGKSTKKPAKPKATKSASVGNRKRSNHKVNSKKGRNK